MKSIHVCKQVARVVGVVLAVLLGLASTSLADWYLITPSGFPLNFQSSDISMGPGGAHLYYYGSTWNFYTGAGMPMEPVLLFGRIVCVICQIPYFTAYWRSRRGCHTETNLVLPPDHLAKLF